MVITVMLIQQAMRVATNTKISLEFVSSRFRVLIKFDRPSVAENDLHQLDLRTGNFAELIGFNKVIVKNDGLGPNLPDIISIDNLYVHYDIISESIVSGRPTDVLYRFSTDGLPLSFPFRKESRRLLWSKSNTNLLRQIRIYITDALNRPVNLNGIPVHLTLLLKKDENNIQ